MANLTFATIKIAANEEMDNTFIIDFFGSINPEKTSYIREYRFPEERLCYYQLHSIFQL